jgi:hypothetical protein
MDVTTYRSAGGVDEAAAVLEGGQAGAGRSHGLSLDKLRLSLDELGLSLDKLGLSLDKLGLLLDELDLGLLPG